MERYEGCWQTGGSSDSNRKIRPATSKPTGSLLPGGDASRWSWPVGGNGPGPGACGSGQRRPEMGLRRIYCKLLQLYPPDYRALFAAEMAAAFDEAVIDRRRRPTGLIAFMLAEPTRLCIG